MGNSTYWLSTLALLHRAELLGNVYLFATISIAACVILWLAAWVESNQVLRNMRLRESQIRLLLQKMEEEESSSSETTDSDTDGEQPNSTQSEPEAFPRLADLCLEQTEYLRCKRWLDALAEESPEDSPEETSGRRSV